MYKTILFVIFSFIILPIASTAKVLAAGTTIYGGAPVYGGGVIVEREGEVLVDKKVRNPATLNFVDHLGPMDPKYKPTQIVTFQIILKNSGEKTLDKVIVSDKIPQFVDYMSGPGSYDSESRTLTFTANNLVGGTSQIFEVKVRAGHQALLPAEKNLICPVNVVETQFDGRTDRDESQFCIEKKMEVVKTPEAGPVNWIVSFLGLGTSFISGLILNKASKK